MDLMTLSVRGIESEDFATQVRVEHYYEKCYRVRFLKHGPFAHIKRIERYWHADIRHGDGVLMMHAGIHDTFREAVAECVSIALDKGWGSVKEGVFNGYGM